MTRTDGRQPKLSWPFRVLLRILPAHVRADRERELEQFMREDMPVGRWNRIRYWAETLLDMLRVTPGAHTDLLGQDLKLTFRQLRRAPGFTILAVLTLGLGIGANAALFTVVDDTLLRPPPFIGVDRLVRVTEEHMARGLLDFGVAPANFRDFVSATADGVEAAAAWQSRSGTVRIGQTPERVTYAAVSGDFFRVFREPPTAGRTLRPADDVPGSYVAVIGHDLWRDRLGGDRSAVGRTIELNGTPLRIIGVMPPDFSYPGSDISLWMPLGLPPDEWERRGSRFLGATFRLAPEATVRDFSQRIATRSAFLAEEFPESNDGWSARVLTLQQSAAAGVRGPLLAVWFGAGLILLIAVVNVANLLVGRAITRRGEMSLRRALGAGFGRLFRLALTESAVLGLLGAAAGIALAAILLALLRAHGADLLPPHGSLRIDARTVVFSVIVAAGVTLLFTVVPTLASPSHSASSASRRGVAGPSRGRARLGSGLVVLEIAIAVVVIVGTGLLARSAARLFDQPLGYDPSGVTTFRLEPPFRVDPNQELPEILRQLEADRRRVGERYLAFMDRLMASPGVETASAINHLPLTGNWWVTGVRIPDSEAPEEDHAAYIRVVLPDYMATMGTRVIKGRDVGRGDVPGAEPVVVVDETFASRFWPGQAPVGQVIELDHGPDSRRRARVVGLVEPIRQSSLEAEPRPTLYVPFAQASEGHGSHWGMDVVVRRPAGPLPEATLERIAAEHLPDAAVFRVMSMEDLIADSVASRRFQLALFSGFAVVALVLTLVGVFGVLALYVRERDREFGVRLALGAKPAQIRWMVHRNALACGALGSAIGMGVAALVAGLFASLVYGVSTYDPLAFLGGPVALVLAAFAGGLVPAWRATRTDPVMVLRSE